MQGRQFSCTAAAPAKGADFGRAGVAIAAGVTAFCVAPHREQPRCDALTVGAVALGGFVLGGASVWSVVSSKADVLRDRYERYWPRKIVILIGAPGAGKGTQGSKITEELGIPMLSTGDMLRDAVNAGTSIGKKAGEVIERGSLVTDDIMIEIIEERIAHADCKCGFILDGFPRSLEHAAALDTLLAKTGEVVSNVVAFDVDAALLEERICGRWLDEVSGRPYHIKFAPPKSMKLGPTAKPVPPTMKDDVSGAPLYQPTNDTAEALKKRLASYESNTAPVLGYYAQKGIVKTIDGGKDINCVTADVLAGLTNK